MSQKHIEARMKRLSGMSAEKREAMEEASAKQIWTAKCRICGQTLHGTPAELAAHKHDGG